MRYFIIAIIVIAILIAVVVVAKVLSCAIVMDQYKNDIDESKSDIAVLLRSRCDLLVSIKKLLDIKDDNDMLISKVSDMPTIYQLNETDCQQVKMINKLCTEDYSSKIKSDNTLHILFNKIEYVSEQIQEGKKDYNSEVSVFNKYIFKFPNFSIAGLKGCISFDSLNEEIIVKDTI